MNNDIETVSQVIVVRRTLTDKKISNDTGDVRFRQQTYFAVCGVEIQQSTVLSDEDSFDFAFDFIVNKQQK